jgi:putative colanic acid biosynthesis acetyltransferase WcaF
VTQYRTYNQQSAYDSPWTRSERLRMLLWEICWSLLCRWTPKPLNPWRLFWLQVFGCRIHGRPFVHQRTTVRIPWNLTLHDRACLGDGACIYSLGPIEVGPRATVAQEVYLCTGTHDFSTARLPLMTAPIVVGADAFIGARAFVLPGITIGEGSVVGAASVVSRDLPAWMICAGNPCRPLRRRELHDHPGAE